MRRHLTTTAAFILFGLLLCTPASAKDSEAQARRLLNALGCKGCHKFEGDGGTLAPALDQVGSRLSKADIRAHLSAHAAPRTQSIMPSFSTLSKADLYTLSTFLHNHLNNPNP